jgi:hypothetical protein
MCKEFGQTCADEQENFRTLLQIYHERSNQLANIIHASNGLIVTILVGVLAFAGTVKNFKKSEFYRSYRGDMHNFFNYMASLRTLCR